MTTTKEEAMITQNSEFATLTVSSHLFCISISAIRETRRWSEVTILPHAPTFVMGAMNLRGIIIPIIDLSQKLGFDPSTPTDRHVIIIIESEEQTIGLLADSVQEIISISEENVHRPPSAAQTVESCVSGLVSHHEEMIRVIDIKLIISSMQGALQ